MYKVNILNVLSCILFETYQTCSSVKSKLQEKHSVGTENRCLQDVFKKIRK